MASADDRDKERVAQNIKKLVLFGRNPADEEAWNEAAIALCELRDTAGLLLADKPREDNSFRLSLTELHRTSRRDYDALPKMKTHDAFSKPLLAMQNSEPRFCWAWPYVRSTAKA